MTRKSRRELEREIDELRDDGDDLVEFEVMSSTVFTVTEDMTDDRGNVIEEREPDVEPPEGYEHAGIIPTESPVVTWHKFKPTGDGDT